MVMLIGLDLLVQKGKIKKLIIKARKIKKRQWFGHVLGRENSGWTNSDRLR